MFETMGSLPKNELTMNDPDAKAVISRAVKAVIFATVLPIRLLLL